MLVVNAANIEKDWNWISSYNNTEVTMENISARTCLLAVQGQCHQNLAATDIYGSDESEILPFCKRKFAGVDNVLISATGYTGAGGVEIYFEDKNDSADKIWDAIFEAGKSLGIKPAGSGGHGIPCGWKWDIVYMEMILMTPLLHWKPDWDGLRGLQTIL